MKTVKIVKRYNDLQMGRIVQPDEIFDVSDERFLQLQEVGVAVEVEAPKFSERDLEKPLKSPEVVSDAIASNKSVAEVVPIPSSAKVIEDDLAEANGRSEKMDKEELEKLSYRDLQKVAIDKGIKANVKRDLLVVKILKNGN